MFACVHAYICVCAKLVEWAQVLQSSFIEIQKKMRIKHHHRHHIYSTHKHQFIDTHKSIHKLNVITQWYYLRADNMAVISPGFILFYFSYNRWKHLSTYFVFLALRSN